MNSYEYFESLKNGGNLLPRADLERLPEFNDDLLHWDASSYRSETRRVTIQQFGFVVPSREMIDAIKLLSPILEVGAGTGFLAHLLAKEDADVIATDFYIRKNLYFPKVGVYFKVTHMGAVAAIRKYPDRNVLCAWPSYLSDFATKALRTLKPGKTFIYIGEGKYGCTANDAFFRYAALHCDEEMIEIPSWRYIHDSLSLYRKRSIIT